MPEDFEMTRDEAELVKKFRASGKTADEFIAGGKPDPGDRETNEPAPKKPAPSDDDAPVTRAELAERERKAERERAKQAAYASLAKSANSVIEGSKELGRVSPQKAAYLRDVAFQKASQTEGVKDMSAAQLQELMGKCAKEAIAEELEERKGSSPGGTDSKKDLDKRMEATKTAAARSDDAGSGGSAASGDNSAAAEAAQELLADMNDMQFGPGVDMEWPSDEQIRQKQAAAADRFLANANRD